MISIIQDRNYRKRSVTNNFHKGTVSQTIVFNAQNEVTFVSMAAVSTRIEILKIQHLFDNLI